MSKKNRRTNEQIIQDLEKQLNHVKSKKNIKEKENEGISAGSLLPASVSNSDIGLPLPLFNGKGPISKTINFNEEKIKDALRDDKSTSTFNSTGNTNAKVEEVVTQKLVGGNISKELLEEGLQELANGTIPNFLQNIVVLCGAEEKVTINRPSKGMSALWAKFALPVLEKYFPNISGEKAFVMFSLMMFGGMVEVKKPIKEKVKVIP